MDEAKTARVALWSRRRIAGEVVLAVVLAWLAGQLDAAVAGFGVRTFAVAAGVAVLSAARRSLPATVLLVTAAAAGELDAATPLLVCASWSAGSRVVGPWRAVAVFAAAFVLHDARSVHTEVTAADPLSWPVAVALATGLFLLLSVGPAMIARYRAQRRELLAVLRRHNDQLVREQAMVARQARLLERNRLAQDMHDSLGHQLVLISVHAGALQVDPDLGERQRDGVRILREASVTAMEELREAVGVLHEERDERGRTDGRAKAVPGTDKGPGTGDLGDGRHGSRTIAALDALVTSSRATGATVDLRRSGTVRPLPPAADHTAYRIAQEGLTNALKHAPGAPIALALRYEPDSLVVEVANGPVPAAGSPEDTPAPVSGGRGLEGLRERTRLVGGMLHTGPGTDGGFRVAGILPYGTGGPHDTGGATFVDQDDDFVGQSGADTPDDSGAVINRADPQGELAATMSKGKNIAIGCAVTAVVVVVGVLGLGAWGLGKLMKEAEKVSLSPSVYEAAKIGDPESALREKLPDGDSVLTEGLEKQGPPVPEGATCLHFMSDDPDALTSVFFRFCFRDGKLVDKQTFTDEV
ncbi:sensor histidine kinase [Streptomyces scabiei]|uniref:sensor histidine kinase n=1 Tax=Streptomyces scabiei TaxID=1930 RepID=UPI00073E7287|nr:histidine kinase [Streptomyces scabiei]